MSRWLLPSATRRLVEVLVGWWWVWRISTMVCKARLSWRSPPRLIP